MKTARWIFGLFAVCSLIVIDIIAPTTLYYKWFYLLILSCFIALIRLAKGPTPVDRAAATKVLSITIIGFCGIMSALYKQHIYIDIALIWAFQAFIGMVILGKYIEGRPLDE